MKAIPVVLCADSNILRGLHVTLFSMLKNSSASLKIYLLHSNLSGKDLTTLKETCRRTDREYELIEISVTNEKFKNFRLLMGNSFAYAKLLIPEFVFEPVAIYCDSDLVFMLDIGELFNEKLMGLPIGASGVGYVDTALEREFYLSVGMSRDTRVFNSGVLLLDLDKWRREEIVKACLEFGSQYADRLLTADQTILNAVFRGKFADIGTRYNHDLGPISAPVGGAYGDRIYHFLGAPKPWDPFGKFAHRHFDVYARFIKQTALPKPTLRTMLSWRTAVRTARISRHYYVCMRELHFVK